MKEIGCKQCTKRAQVKDSRQVFCSRSCANAYNNVRRNKRTVEQRRKTSESLKEFYKKNPRVKGIPEDIERGARSQRGRHKKDVSSILELSSRTVYLSQLP